MLAKELLTNNITPLKTSDTGIMALNMMEEYRTSHLPVASSGIYYGLVSEDDIYSYNRFEDPIGAHPISQANISALTDQHIYDIMQLIHENSLSLLPIVDNKNHYIGSIITKELLIKLSEITGVINPGGIIVLDMNIHDYSLSEIAQIVESNNQKIINSFVNSFEDSTRIEVTLKLNSVDIEAVLQTFIRYNYQIKASYTDVDLNDNLSDRYDSLMNYLNI